MTPIFVDPCRLITKFVFAFAICKSKLLHQASYCVNTHHGVQENIKGSFAILQQDTTFETVNTCKSQRCKMCTPKYPTPSNSSFQCTYTADLTTFTSALYHGQAASCQW
jgi:hypothetical protein